MEITEVFYPKVRQDLRNWFKEHYLSKDVVWIRRFKKAANQPCITYDELVEECLCFGWIDGIIKKLDTDSNVQRITPRRKKSFLSELNRQRVWKLQQQGLMTPHGLKVLEGKIGDPKEPLEIPDWILKQLQEDPEVWENFQNFSHYYKRLKISWVKEGQRRMEEAQKRLNYLIKNTKKGKMYGTSPLD